MTSARSVFLYLCVSLAAVAALALTAGAASPDGSPSCAETSSAPSSEFLSGHSFHSARQPVANAHSKALTHARAGRLLHLGVASSAANAIDEFKNTQENAGPTARHVGSSGRNEKRGTESL